MTSTVLPIGWTSRSRSLKKASSAGPRNKEIIALVFAQFHRGDGADVPRVADIGQPAMPLAIAIAIATAKGGRYRCYRCSRRLRRGETACQGHQHSSRQSRSPSPVPSSRWNSPQTAMQIIGSQWCPRLLGNGAP
jgi:hypothetical protein